MHELQLLRVTKFDDKTTRGDHAKIDNLASITEVMN
jgi:hypothetical protein